MKKRFLFLYLKTGGGHISNAKALQEYMQEEYPQVDVVLGDGLEKSKVIKKILEDGYAKMQAKWQSFYEFLYACNKLFVVAKANQLLISEFTEQYVQQLIEKEHPTNIIIFHFFLIKPVQEVLAKLNLSIPVTTIVTDPFTAPRLRFLEQKMNYIVYSEQAKQIAITEEIASQNIKVFPSMLNKKFIHTFTEQESKAIKKKLGFSLDKKIILMLWWGDGMPKGEIILQECIDQNIDAHICIVCGKNKQLFKQIQSLQKAYPTKDISVYGFIDFVQELITVADIVITKAGPATLMEILYLGKVSVITSYLWEQEKWNVDYVLNNQVGIYEKDIKKMVKKVEELLNTGLTFYQDNIQKLGLQNGTPAIAEELMK